MSTFDDDDGTDGALTRLGQRLRTDAERRPADLDRLGVRIHAERQRARLAVVAGCVAVVLVLGVAIGVRASGSTDSLQVGGTGEPGASGSTATTEVPRWTVNPSLPADPANGEVWGVDVVYDPAVWDYRRLTDQPALDLVRHTTLTTSSIGMASYRAEPRLQAYWQGSGARAVAESVRDELLALPGIVSVEVGRAEPTSRPPGTSGVTPSLPPVAPTTVVAVERPELPDPRPTQAELLADGNVTDDEYELAFWTWVECAEGAGATVQVRGRGEDGRIQYSVSGGRQAADDCYQAGFMQVDMTWQLALDAARSTTTAGRVAS